MPSNVHRLCDSREVPETIILENRRRQFSLFVCVISRVPVVLQRPIKNVGQCDGSLAKESSTNVNRTEMKDGGYAMWHRDPVRVPDRRRITSELAGMCQEDIAA